MSPNQGLFVRIVGKDRALFNGFYLLSSGCVVPVSTFFAVVRSLQSFVP